MSTCFEYLILKNISSAVHLLFSRFLFLDLVVDEPHTDHREDGLTSQPSTKATKPRLTKMTKIFM